MVWLADMRDFDDHDREWNDWVDVDPPVRACVEARLRKPGLRVEIRAGGAPVRVVTGSRRVRSLRHVVWHGVLL
jgi:hypothetical protein